MKCSDLMLFPVSIPRWHRGGSPLHPTRSWEWERLRGCWLGCCCCCWEELRGRWGLLEMTSGLRAWRPFVRKAKTILDMEQDRKIVFTRPLHRKIIGRNHWMSCLKIRVETMGLVQANHTGLFFHLSTACKLGSELNCLRPLEKSRTLLPGSL